MGNVVFNNATSLIMNVGLCVILEYYVGNQVNPNTKVEWTGVGSVWFTIAGIPWYGPESDFGERHSVEKCIVPYNNYKERIPKMAATVSKDGEARLEYFTIIGSNVTYNEAEERLRNMMYWGDGFRLIGKEFTLQGGPPAHRVNGRLIDISEPFEPITISFASDRICYKHLNTHTIPK